MLAGVAKEKGSEGLGLVVGTQEKVQFALMWTEKGWNFVQHK